ncbi:MAG: EF-hand domain-containing protein [Pseudomonadota bacterium]
MTPPPHPRFAGLMALGLALASPVAFAQSANEPTPTDGAKAAEQTPPKATQPAQPAKKTWAELDTDKNGKLDKSEAASIPALQSIFDQADADADGQLSGDEYKAYLAAHRQDTSAPPGSSPGK